MTLDEICETFDELGLSGDTPVVIKFDGEVFDLAAIVRESDGSVTFELEEA